MAFSNVIPFWCLEIDAAQRKYGETQEFLDWILKQDSVPAAVKRNWQEKIGKKED